MTVTKWVPEGTPKILRRVGKTGEECAELAKVCFRITIQGLDGIDPATGRTNREELAREIADVLVQCELTIADLRLDREAVHRRTGEKFLAMAEWEAMFDDDKGDNRPHGYLVDKLKRVMPLFQEARDALVAITEAQRRLHGIDPMLAERMDRAGYHSLEDWRAQQESKA